MTLDVLANVGRSRIARPCAIPTGPCSNTRNAKTVYVSCVTSIDSSLMLLACSAGREAVMVAAPSGWRAALAQTNQTPTPPRFEKIRRQTPRGTRVHEVLYRAPEKIWGGWHRTGDSSRLQQANHRTGGAS